MKIAFWSVTRGAGEVAKRIGKKVEGDIYTLKKFNIEESIQIENFSEELEKKFSYYDGHIFIMATGIVIRKIAPLIKRKDIDPAVLVIDEGENFVISLLSGHIGGANELTYKIAQSCSLLPIITTSSDVTGKIAIDTIAQKLNCEMESLTKAKELTSLIVDNKKVDILLPNNVKLGKNKNSSGVVIVSNKKNIDIMRLYPKNIIIGIGCKRGTPKEEIEKALDEIMRKHNLAYESIKKISTVDIKADENGIIELAQSLNRELIIISREDIKKVEDRFVGSEFVKKQIGVSCVSEPCALLASNGDGKFLEQKYIQSGITISIYEEKFGDE